MWHASPHCGQQQGSFRQRPKTQDLKLEVKKYSRGKRWKFQGAETAKAKILRHLFRACKGI